MLLPGDKYNKPQIPENYFDKFSQELNQKLSEQETFEEKDFPILFSSKKEDGLIIPDNYMDAFKPNLKEKTTKSSSRLVFLIATASILISAAIFALSGNKEIPIQEKIETEEILRFFAEDNEIFDSYDDVKIESILTAENVSRFPDLEEEILIDYLYEDADQIDLAWLY